MSPSKLDAAIQEADRFLAAARRLRNASLAAPGYQHPKESGAARRASLDLTRALADLRRR